MKESFFKIKNQYTEEIIFKKNLSFTGNINDLDFEFDFDNKIQKIENNKAIVKFTLNIFKESKEYPFYISVTQTGIFEWDEQVNEYPLSIDTLLNINAPALLLSYIRSIVSQATAFSGYPSFVIPLINFNK